MTPAELLAWAESMDAWHDSKQECLREDTSLPDWKRWLENKRLADLRLAARLARFAAERGGLKEETDGTQD